MMFLDKTFLQKKYRNGILTILCMFAISVNSVAQETVEQQKKETKAAQNFLREAQQLLQKNEFPPAEADYRKAISLNPKSETAKYNLGAAYYRKDKNAEAMLRFKQAAATATEKSEKHKAFHNLGNTYMNEKKIYRSRGSL